MSNEASGPSVRKVPGVGIESVTLSDNTKIPIVGGGVTVVVGGNNAGKSTLLRQIYNLAYSGPNSVHTPGQYVMVKEISVKKTGTEEDLWEWLKGNAVYQRPSANNPHLAEGYVRVGVSHPIRKNEMPNHWRQVDTGHFGPLAPFLLSYAEAGSRAGNPFSTGRRPRPGDPPTDPIHYLEDSPPLRRRVAGLFQDLFDHDLTLDKLGQSATLRVGTPSPDVAPPGYNESEVAFREELDRLPMLGSQGDGMKSLIGLILPIVAATHSIILIDEPEAFLHPPQAVKLGKILGALAVESGAQIILATHDRGILVGLLESESPLSVVRLSRKGNDTKASQLEPAEIIKIWSDPVLRYSHVLDGLFHRAVVVVENERDCTFYSASMDAAAKKGLLSFPPGELLFVPTNGKDGMPVVVSALSALKVPIVATPDIDMLNDSGKMKKIVSSLGKNWDDFRSEYEHCTAPFRQPKPEVQVAQVREQIDKYLKEILDDSPSSIWNQEIKDHVRMLTRSNESPWEQLKKFGNRAFPQYVSYRAENFLESLDSIGLVLVRVGDLEAFAKGFNVTARKGLGWLEAALRNRVHEGDEAIAHAIRVFTSVSGLTESGDSKEVDDALSGVSGVSNS